MIMGHTLKATLYKPKWCDARPSPATQPFSPSAAPHVRRDASRIEYAPSDDHTSSADPTGGSASPSCRERRAEHRNEPSDIYSQSARRADLAQRRPMSVPPHRPTPTATPDSRTGQNNCKSVLTNQGPPSLNPHKHGVATPSVSGLDLSNRAGPAPYRALLPKYYALTARSRRKNAPSSAPQPAAMPTGAASRRPGYAGYMLASSYETRARQPQPARSPGGLGVSLRPRAPRHLPQPTVRCCPVRAESHADPSRLRQRPAATEFHPASPIPRSARRTPRSRSTTRAQQTRCTEQRHRHDRASTADPRTWTVHHTCACRHRLGIPYSGPEKRRGPPHPLQPPQAPTH